jgi:Rrf2 family iron-sulfur cluster assembly transcriptional regulator
MKISTKGRYAVMAMIELAIHSEKELLPLAELSLAQDISISYLEQLFARLRAGGLVAGVRGPRGGYRVARPAQEITLAEILKAADDKADPFRQHGARKAHPRGEMTSQIWQSFSEHMYHYLNGISLAQLLGAPEIFRQPNVGSQLSNTLS